FLYQIKTSDKCFHALEKVIQESLTVQEGTEEELAACAEDISLADKALELISKQPETEIELPQPVKEKTFSLSEYAPRFAYAFAAIVVIALAAWGGVRYYNTTYQIQKAEALLEENVTFYIRNRPRLAGDYPSRGVDILMSDTDPADSSSYLTNALHHTQHAIERGSTSPKARQLQAQVFILEKEYGKADSIFSLIAEKSKTKAELLNDQGVLKFKQNKWHEAEQHFRAAIQVDSTFKEAYYNLALAQDKLGNKQQAVATLKRYLPLETDEGWKNAAREYLKDLEGES
ncbi:MAG: tetratricopeptide repeat protein, partial [Aliifodinibius sp.]|nr:tetratricopeptide repeat protein [candidate division KSB1 bacterium]NIT61791.1 tetratricopeptide repeat protein [Fodinibius sp.]NIS28094.1 tetratricopeptide repeat protein [candidate division KSB1 bacterium]NIU28774.1 tetratricopeptide repeat protein [candidate division KSB1 bacterium]NIU92950.1 tetratricopeptide repeat protein [candidate division KSB1 bacterium]